jgi:hypothetical protein
MSVWQDGRVFAIYQRGSAPTDEVWEGMLVQFRARRGRDVRTVVEANHAGPNAKQRKQLAEALQGVDYRGAILTDSIAIRTLITGLSWLGVPHHAFGLHDHERAARWLGLDTHELELVRERLAQLRLTTRD